MYKRIRASAGSRQSKALFDVPLACGILVNGRRSRVIQTKNQHIAPIQTLTESELFEQQRELYQ